MWSQASGLAQGLVWQVWGHYLHDGEPSGKQHGKLSGKWDYVRIFFRLKAGTISHRDRGLLCIRLTIILTPGWLPSTDMKVMTGCVSFHGMRVVRFSKT